MSDEIQVGDLVRWRGDEALGWRGYRSLGLDSRRTLLVVGIKIEKWTFRDESLTSRELTVSMGSKMFTIPDFDLEKVRD